MRVEFVDLYQVFAVPRKHCLGGYLMCYIQTTAGEISPGRRRPGVLVIPGGGYHHVSPRESEPVAMRFYARGYSAFVLTYSVGPVSMFPDSLREAAMAMRYIREHAAQLEVDPHMIGAVGFSAGGHLCGTLGTMFDLPTVAHIAPPHVIRPDALGLCYPVAVSWGHTHEGSFQHLTRGDQELRAMLSLEKLVRPDMPPVYLWHTRDDDTVPLRNSLLVAQALDEARVPFAMHIYHHGAHGLSTADTGAYPAEKLPDISPDVPEWPDKMMMFWSEIGFKVTDKEELF